jgi:hypothetical protein
MPRQHDNRQEKEDMERNFPVLSGHSTSTGNFTPYIRLPLFSCVGLAGPLPFIAP